MNSKRGITTRWIRVNYSSNLLELQHPEVNETGLTVPLEQVYEAMVERWESGGEGQSKEVLAGPPIDDFKGQAVY